MSTLPSLADFTRHLNQAFTLDLGEQAIAAELIEARSLGAAAPGEREPFSLVFRIASSSVVPQRIYTLHHAELGDLEIFLVPIGPDDEGMRLEAVFT